jgi:hypothetical protein
LFSTRRTLEPDSGSNMPEAAEAAGAAEVAEAAGAAAEVAAVVEAAEAAPAAYRWEVAASARVEHFPDRSTS